MRDIIHIKPHHFIDIITTLGKGISLFKPTPHGHNVHKAAHAILANPELMLQMELGTDDICAPCIHNIEGQCDDRIDTSWRPEAPSLKRDWNLLIDRRWCERLGLNQGDMLTARGFCTLLDTNITNLRAIYREIPADNENLTLREPRLRRGIDDFLKLKSGHINNPYT